MEANNAATREALVKIRDIIMGGGFDGRSPAYIVNICDAALSAPPRQCDVGTTEEQQNRFNRFCRPCADGCPFLECRTIVECAIKWAQTPYEAELKGEGDGK